MAGALWNGIQASRLTFESSHTAPLSSADGDAGSRFGRAGGGLGGIRNKENLIINYNCFALISAVTNNITHLFFVSTHLKVNH